MRASVSAIGHVVRGEIDTLQKFIEGGGPASLLAWCWPSPRGLPRRPLPRPAPLPHPRKHLLERVSTLQWNARSTTLLQHVDSGSQAKIPIDLETLFDF